MKKKQRVKDTKYCKCGYKISHKIGQRKFINKKRVIEDGQE